MSIIGLKVDNTACKCEVQGKICASIWYHQHNAGNIFKCQEGGNLLFFITFVPPPIFFEGWILLMGYLSLNSK